MPVSSLCTTSPSAAWRTNSLMTGSSFFAASFTMSHWVDAGSGISSIPCRPARRLNGRPLPYLSRPIMAAAFASYFSSPTPNGDAAANTSPQRPQRKRSRW